jgi:hypothetical protein
VVVSLAWFEIRGGGEVRVSVSPVERIRDGEEGVQPGRSLAHDLLQCNGQK